MKQKIAVLTDSGSDTEINNHKNLFILPLNILINEKAYTDRVDINLEEVLEKLDSEKITTSLPTPEKIIETLNEIKAGGFTHVIVVTISSQLSGTFNIIRMIAEDYEGLDIKLIDTKNISRASGYTAYHALELIEQGKTSEEIVEELTSNLEDKKVFFTIRTVEYLRKGGRIGLVAGAVASLLNIKPVISCNDKGVYYTVNKTRGFQKAIEQLTTSAEEYVGKYLNYDLTILVARVDDTIKSVIETVKEKFSKVRNLDVKSVSPALAIHIGPESVGIAIRRLEIA